MKPQPGDPAPDFSLPADDGPPVSRDGLLGRRYVLYFYPKDDTPGCTTQACSMRDNFQRVIATGAEVFGVSPDSVKSHQKFRARYDLPYRLLSDADHSVAEAYDVWVDKTFRGRSYKGVERSSFVIGPDGRVEHVLEKVKPAEHVDLLLEAMAA
ncbi:MAG TPA: thioredoxin-dependent thiol peroxidase [Methylomirabilota bacterium]